MSLRYTISREDSVIQVRTEGVFDFVAAYEMWEEIVLACTAANCLHVLGFSFLEQPLPPIDAYEHMGILQSVGVTRNHRIAWVAERPLLLDSLKRVESVVQNRSDLVFRVFKNGTEATRWLKACD